MSLREALAQPSLLHSASATGSVAARIRNARRLTHNTLGKKDEERSALHQPGSALAKFEKMILEQKSYVHQVLSSRIVQIHAAGQLFGTVVDSRARELRDRSH